MNDLYEIISFMCFRIPFDKLVRIQVFVFYTFIYQLCFFLFCLFPFTSLGQWKLLSSNLDNVGISAICANDNVWLVGEHKKDVLWYSTDKGKSWKTTDKGDKSLSYGYKNIANNNGKIVAGGFDGDKGYWGTYESSGQKRIGGGFSGQSINVISYSNDEWLRVEYGLILRSVDGGITWKAEQPKVIPNTAFFPYTAIEKNGILYIGGYLIGLVSADKGKNFQLMDLPDETGSFMHFTICNDKIIGVFSRTTTEKKDLKIYTSPLGVKPVWTLQNDISESSISEIWRFEGYKNHLFGISLGPGPTNLFYSTDFGKTIATVSNGLTASSYPFCIQVLGDTVLLGTSKGLYWTRLSEINKATVLSNQKSNENTIAVYPNPAGHTFTVETTLQIKKIEIIDLLGKIQSIEFQIIAKNKVRFSSEQLANGLYLINLFYSDQSKESKRIVVQH